MTAENIAHSPDGQQSVRFEVAGEIQMSVPYFYAFWNDQPLGNRYFGDIYLSSTDARYLGLQEWLSLSRGQGPETRILILDTVNNRECTLGEFKGFIIPVQFLEKGLLCKWTCYQQEPQDQFLEFPPEEDWRAIDSSSPARPWAEQHSVIWPLLAILLWALPWVCVIFFLAVIALAVWGIISLLK